MIAPSRQGAIRELTRLMEAFVVAGDAQAADILWQSALQLRDLEKPGPSKAPLPALRALPRRQ
jgi:hypothetical protein